VEYPVPFLREETGNDSDELMKNNKAHLSSLKTDEIVIA
jgi:hypothetical protein